MDKINIKRLEKSDIDSIINPFLRAFASSPWYDFWDKNHAKKRILSYMDAPCFYGIYLSLDEKPIGALLGNMKVQADGKVFHLEEFFIDPRHQGRGYGKILYEKMLKDMKKSGAIGVIYTTIRNSPAHQAYLAMGAFEMDNNIVLGHDLKDD